MLGPGTHLSAAGCEMQKAVFSGGSSTKNNSKEGVKVF